MLDELKPTAMAYAVADGSLKRLVGDFTAADWGVRDAVGHDPRWITGHLAVYRNRVAALMGLPAVTPAWEAAFVRGTSSADVPADLDMEQVVAAFHAATAAIAGGWDRLTREDLAKPFGRTLPDGSDTVGGALHFMAWHEAYHLGQLGLLRRLAGKAGVA